MSGEGVQGQQPLLRGEPGNGDSERLGQLPPPPAHKRGIKSHWEALPSFASPQMLSGTSVVTSAPHGSVIPAFASSAERRWALIAGIWEVGQEYRCVTYYAFVLKVAGEMGMLMNEV